MMMWFVTELIEYAQDFYKNWKGIKTTTQLLKEIDQGHDKVRSGEFEMTYWRTKQSNTLFNVLTHSTTIHETMEL